MGAENWFVSKTKKKINKKNVSMLWYFIQYLNASVCLLMWEQPVVVMKVIRSSKKKKKTHGVEGMGHSSLMNVASCYCLIARML